MERKFLFALGLALVTAQAFGSVYYVATDGNDSNAGSEAKPFASLNKANAVVHAGDTVWIRGGVYDLKDTVYYKRYQMTAGILLTASGESDDNRIHYLAFPGEHPIFDATNMPVGPGPGNSKNDGTVENTPLTSPLVIEAKYLHLKGFEIRNGKMVHNSNPGVFVYASKHIFFEQVDSHHNAGAGFFVHDGASGGGGHLFLNCDAHDNYDPTGWQGDGENADGFGVHYQNDGDTTRFIGCRSWWNSDDGWDVLAQEFPVIIENSYAMGNGYVEFGTRTPPNGNGNGFKMGYSRNNKGRHTVRNSYAWNNTANGFYANYTSIGSYWYNNTSYNNKDRSFSMASTTYSYDSGTQTYTRTSDVAALLGDEAHVLKNNLAYPVPTKLSQIGECWVKNSTTDKYIDCPAGENNSWNLNLALTADDFESLDDPSMTVTGEDLSKIPGILGPRNADGSVPNVGFLKLKAGSKAIDKGVDLGFPYAGAAPDLGAFEYGMPKSSSSSVIPSEGEGSSSSAVVPGSSAESANSSAAENPVAESSAESANSSTAISSTAISSAAEPENSGTTSIAWNQARLATAQGSATVFDMQGRYLGALQASELRDGNIIDAVQAKFKTPGAYLVRYEHIIQKVTVK